MIELDVAVELAQKAGKRIMELYNDSTTDIKEFPKLDHSILTQADVDSNRIILDGLKDAFPRYAVLSEESVDDKKRLSSDDLWIVDPLDGTKDFKGKTGDFSVMIAYAWQKHPIVAVVYEPALGKLYTAELGGGTYLLEKGQQTRLKVSPHPLEEAIIMLSRKEFAPDAAEAVRQLLGMKGVIQAGSMSIKVGYIAEGKGDLYVNNDPNAGEWDSCAPQLILEESGGKMSDYDGKPIAYNKEDPHMPRGIVCSNGPIHDAILKKIEPIIPLKKMA